MALTTIWRQNYLEMKCISVNMHKDKVWAASPVKAGLGGNEVIWFWKHVTIETVVIK